MEFLLDENVSVKTLKRLRSKNLVVRSVRSENILGIKNGNLLSLCKNKKWILITHDKDFLKPSIPDHYGIILVNIHPAIDSVAGEIIEKFLELVDDKIMLEKLVVLEKNSWRYKT